MKSNSSIYRCFAGLAASVALLGNIHTAHAAGSASWLAAPFNNNWIAAATTNNWSSGVGNYPGATSGTSSADIATFNANSSQTTVNCASAFVIGGITFDTANAAAYTINTSGGTWRVSLAGNPNGAVIRSTSTVVNKQTINGTLRLASTGTLSLFNDSTTAAATLNILGGCAVNNSGTSGMLVLGGANTGGNIMGPYTEALATASIGSLIKTNAGMWILTGNNTYHSNTFVVGGTLLLMGSGAIPNTPNIIVNNGTLNISNTMTLTANMWLTNSGILALTNTTVGTTPFTIGTLTVSNATLQLGVNASAPYTDLSVSSALNVGPHTTLAIAKVVGVTSPTLFTLINYAGADPNPANFIVTVPQGYSASPVSVGSGNVTVTVTPPVNNALVWVGATNSVPVSNWDTNKTKNWVDAATLTVAQAYVNPDSAQFDDTAANSTVTLITTNTPTTLDVNNSSLNYVFNGAGKISGTTALTKEGTAALTLADNGDDFSGGITVSAGTLTLDNTNGNISGGLTVAFGATAQIGNNDNFGALPVGAIDTEGTLIFQRANNYTAPASITGNGSVTQNGNGVLTFNTTNGYAGITTVSRGTLALTAGGAVSNSPGLLVSNATFDVSALAGTTLLYDFSVANAHISVGFTNLVTPIITGTFEADGITAVSNIINVVNLPTIASYPVTLTVIQSASPMNLGSGNFNFALGTLPSASTAYHGHLLQSADQTAVLLVLTAGPSGPRTSVTWVGVDNSTPTTNWSDRNNWQLPGVPSVIDNVIFGSGNTTSGNNIVNNFVDANSSVSTLTYNQTASGQWHVTQIPAGNSLTVNGATTIGGLTSDGVKTEVAMVDAGTLTLNNNLTIGNVGVTTADSGTALDLSGLSNFVFNANSGSIVLGPNNRSAANFLLAGVSNKITASSIDVNIASSSSTASGTLTLGPGTNVVNVGTIDAGGQRTSGTIQFGTGVTGAGLRMRGVLGTDASRANMTLGNRNAGSSSGGTTTGTLSLNGSTVDLKLGTLTLGVCNQAAGLIGTGNLQFDTGTVDATNILMAVNSAAGSANGTITVGASGTLVIGKGGMSMGNNTSSGTATATLNINGGTVVCNGSITKATASGSANVTVTGGTLSVAGGTVGTLGSPIDNLTLNSGSTLQLAYYAGLTNIAANISAAGPITVNIGSFSPIGTAPVQVPLIYYTGADPYSSLVLGSVALGYIVGNGGALVDNVANQTIDIIVTPPPQIAFAPVGANSFQLSWPPERLGWRLEVQTNSLAVGLVTTSNGWFTVPGSTSVTNVTITKNPTVKGAVYYRLTTP